MTGWFDGDARALVFLFLLELVCVLLVKVLTSGILTASVLLKIWKTSQKE